MATLAYSRSILSWLNHPLPFGTKVAKRFEKIWSTKEQKVNSSALIFQSTVPLSNREIRILTQNAFFTHDQPICSLPSETTQREEILHQTPGCYKSQDTSAIASRAPCSPMRYSILTVAMPKGSESVWTLLGECCKPNKFLTRHRDAGQDLVPQFSGGAIHSESSTWAQKPSRVTASLLCEEPRPSCTNSGEGR